MYFCGFKFSGTIAQLVEQRTENPCVPGSIPGGTTKNPVIVLNNRIFYLFFYKHLNPSDSIKKQI